MYGSLCSKFSVHASWATCHRRARSCSCLFVGGMDRNSLERHAGGQEIQHGPELQGQAGRVWTSPRKLPFQSLVARGRRRGKKAGPRQFSGPPGAALQTLLSLQWDVEMRPPLYCPKPAQSFQHPGYGVLAAPHPRASTSNGGGGEQLWV